MPTAKKTRKPSHIRNQLHHHDPDFLDGLIPYFDAVQAYFRYETIGLDNIPKGRGCLVVMNHGIIPYHSFLLTKSLIENRGIYPRGLGAGFLFSVPLVKDFFLKGGAVNANPRNAIELLKQKQCVLLAPGGIYEGLVCQPGMDRIPWERRKGFIHTAIEAGAPIIPTYCDGINEVYLNSKFLLRQRIKILERTRFSLPLFMGLGLIPFPKKLVHFIGKPIPVKAKKGESKNKRIERLHHEVLDSMRKMMGGN